MNQPERRRKRPAVSCALCRRRKIRCNREVPCSNCVRSKNAPCIYEHPPSPSQQQTLDRVQRDDSEAIQESWISQCLTRVDKGSGSSRASTAPSHPVSSRLTGSTSTPTVISQVSTRDIESMRSKIMQLEDQLSQATRTPAKSPAQTSNSVADLTVPRIPEALAAFRESRIFGQLPHVIPRSVMHKTRLFGQSHWTYGAALVMDILEIIEPLIQKDGSKVSYTMRRYKQLAKIIKSNRLPPWPTPLSTDLPSKDVADELVDCYLRTFESVYRVLHVPSFRRDYEALWVPDSQPSSVFLVQLRLVYAIGAVMYDGRFSLRTSAIRWLYEAQTWVSQPDMKSRLNLPVLQTQILLLLAREAVGIGADLVWISVGSLLRTAVYMGMHRDPTHLPKRSTFAVEMRRRLWNTVLEMTLQSSMDSGGPPLISLEDFDAEPPGNFDDEQITANDPVPKAEDEFTQMSVAIAFQKTVPLRLAALKFLNNLNSNNRYEETLRLDAEMRASFKGLRRALPGLNSGSEPASFQARFIDLIMHRYLSSIHIPFFSQALHETSFAFSRKVIVESSLKLWRTIFPASTMKAAQPEDDRSPFDCDDFVRLAICGSTFTRTTAAQAIFLISTELKTQLQEEDILGPVPLRPDLTEILEEARAWSFACIEAGETNVKGYLFVCVASALIRGLSKGLSYNEVAGFLVETIEEAEKKWIPILEEKAASYQAQDCDSSLPKTCTSIPLEQTEDWDFLLSDPMFNFGSTGPTGWFFADENMPEVAFL